MSENVRASMLKVAIALAAVYLIWGSTYLAIRFAIETLPPFLMASARFLVAGGLLYAWARWKGAPRPSPVHWRSAALIGMFLLLGGNGGVVWAEQRVDSGLAALLVSTEPLWIVLLVWLLPGGNRPTMRVVTGLLLGFAGLVLLVNPSATTDGVDPLGAAVIVLAALSWAWGSLYGQRARLPESPLLTTGMQMLCGGGLLFLASLVAGEPANFDPAAVSLRSALALGYLLVFGSLVAFTAYVWLLRAASPVLVSTYAYVNPVVAVLLGWVLAGEPLTVGTLIAAAVILSGVALITSSQAKSVKGEKPAAVLEEEASSWELSEAVEVEPEVCASR
ncbi:MAG TPA: drug/metabolite exporter YedA [Thermoanaerobaculia bacterium]|nr:drug/metabolite exporter YedA [Thermoanaerobaculia bacterium]